ncbi:Hypothetical_protein [Hexamita inflata]|uniref:Hypothetical_protein n=1 Tax=Hexamita inflata TaxID=28002 RepID=A0AA86RDU5_9EUKA|nr:Hypothetical protein HINF_LOCUS63425 [Hexamita inflata]
MELVNSFEMECNTMKYTTANKTSVLVRRLIDLSNYLILLVVCGISSWQYAHHGFLLENIIITACAVILSIATTIIAEKKVNQCRSKTYCILTISTWSLIKT